MEADFLREKSREYARSAEPSAHVVARGALRTSAGCAAVAHGSRRGDPAPGG